MIGNWQQAQSGLYVPADVELPRRRPTCVDLFCGAGGFSLGFIQAGFEVVAACDYDESCALTYMTNLGTYPIDIHYVEPADKDRLNTAVEKFMVKKHGKVTTIGTAGSAWLAHGAEPGTPGVGHFFLGDIRKVRGKDILSAVGMKAGDLDCVIGGPPCQGFSKAGKRNVMDPRNSLIFEYARLIVELQPKTFVMENVPGITTMVTPEGIPVLDAFSRIIADGGFGTYDAIRRSLDGQPTRRAVMRGMTHVSEPDEDIEAGQLSLLQEA